MELVVDFNHKQGRKKIDFYFSNPRPAPLVSTSKFVTRIARNAETYHLIRAQDVDLKEVGLPSAKIIFASGSVRSDRDFAGPNAVFAGGSVHLTDAASTIIVAGGDVTLDRSCASCVVIARGKVQCGSAPFHSYIISGKSVSCNRKGAVNCTIVENAENPLDIIRSGPGPVDDRDPAREERKN